MICLRRCERGMKPYEKYEINTVLKVKKVTRFGIGAKLDCAKEFIGRRVCILIAKD